ncbi:Primosomal replication protein n (modular protein) [Burkholderiales bacterium]|nr:Primosomal replication protein n (modular protein) [Burkholderiales bacterium]
MRRTLASVSTVRECEGSSTVLSNVNHVQLSGTLIERTALRYTPAGIAVIEAQLQHLSQTVEAGMGRRLAFAFGAIALGGIAKELAEVNLGSDLALSGFLAPRSRRSTRLLVHVLEFRRPAAPATASADRND